MPIVLAVTVYAILCAVGWLWDYRIWNGGTCRRNGLPWRYMDMDSQGGVLLFAGDCHVWLGGWICVDSAVQD